MAQRHTILSKYGAAHQTIINRYEQCRSSPALSPPNAYMCPPNGDFSKGF